MPYLTREQVTTLFEDLPPAYVRGRSGKRAGQRVAAAAVDLGPRACAALAHDATATAAATHDPGTG